MLLATAFGTGCTATLQGLPAGSIVGRPGVYDYSPSAIESKGRIQVWWCGYAANPNDSSQDSDTILYSTIDPLTGAVSKPVTVMGETPGAWDSAYTCNPQVVGGTFVNPLGNGKTYSYAMYYVGTDKESGFGNSIGVAFSNDGVHWQKYPQPVIRASTETSYGVGQPAPYNSDGKSAIRLFYEDSNRSDGVAHKEATSSDGMHFAPPRTLTSRGLRDCDASWGDMAFDPNTGFWYAVFNLAPRGSSTTGHHQERGQQGVQLYRIRDDALFTGSTPWQELHTFDTNATGNESNFVAGFLRGPSGNLDVGSYPTIQLLTSISSPRPAWNDSPGRLSRTATPNYWDVGVDDWTPGQPLLALDRYKNSATYDVTTGYVDPNGGFALDQALGHLYESPQKGADLPLYACKRGATGYFVSKSSACDGQYIIGLEGYAYAKPPGDVKTQPLYRCHSASGDFLSNRPKCEGQGSGELLGFDLP